MEANFENNLPFPSDREIFGHWRPKLRVSAILLVIFIGAALWIHASVAPGWYDSGVVPVSDLAQLTGAILVLGAFMGGMVTILFPGSARSASRSPIIIGIDRNQLYVSGKGKFSGVAKRVTANSEAPFAFSNDQLYIADPDQLESAIESVLVSLNTRIKPFVAIMSFDNGKPRPLAKSERQLIADAVSRCQALEYIFITPVSPYFDGDLPERVKRAG